MSALKKNIAALFALQGANYVLPLVMVPYLVRVLGPENYGRIAFAQAFINYFVVLSDYGFNLTATHAIAQVHGDRVALSSIFSAVMVVKAILAVAGFLILIAVVLAIPRFSNDTWLFVLVYLTVIGNVLFPVWLFQGLERMGHITTFTVAARAVVVVGIFTLVRHASDYHLAAALQAGGMVLAGIGALVVIPRMFQVHFVWPGWATIRATVVDGWHVFLSTAAISLYTSTNTFVLGLVTNSVAVGYFAAAQKLISAAQGLLGPVAQAVYPHIAVLKAQSGEAALRFIGKLLRWQGAGTLLISVALFALAEPLVSILFGPQFHSSVDLVRWMAALPFVIGLSNVFGIQTMLNFDMKQPFTHIIVASGLVNIALIVPLAHWLSAEGAAISVLVTEIIVTTAMARVLVRKGIWRSIVGQPRKVAA